MNAPDLRSAPETPELALQDLALPRRPGSNPISYYVFYMPPYLRAERQESRQKAEIVSCQIKIFLFHLTQPPFVEIMLTISENI